MTVKLTTYSIRVLFLLIGVTVFSQQDAQFTQYMYNMSVLNPAYALGDADAINIGGLYRAQWVGSVGGPTTGSFFAHTTLTDRVEGGISIVHDQIGDVVKETNAFIDIAYVLPMSATSKLSLGIKTGVTFFNTDFNGFIYSDPEPDIAFAENLSKNYLNFGFGAYYFTENYYVGFSAPNLLRSKHLDSDSGIIRQGVEEIHYFLTGGYVFNLNDRLKLKPAFMAKAVNGAPLSMDLTANVLWNERIELGAGYRFDDSISALANFRVTPTLRLGYAYDYTLSNLGKFNSGTHEIMILFDISKLGNGYDKSPRFF